jgi:peptidyl-prolyl cis-trans isomerase B (cyclophilin B)
MLKRSLIAVAAASLTLGVAGAASATALSPAAPRVASTHRVSKPASSQRSLQTGRGAGRAATPGCGYTASIPADRFKGIPVFNAAAAAQPYVARLITTQGPISFRALTTAAPCTTYSFRFLAQRGYFDGTHCHRLTTQEIFVLQCGDPTGTGSGGPGYSFNDENLSGATYPAGTVAMANAGPNTNGSQFFIVWKDTQLSPAYTPFGQVVGGLGVLQRIAAAGDDQQNGPGDGYPNLFTAFLHVQIVPTR